MAFYLFSTRLSHSRIGFDTYPEVVSVYACVSSTTKYKKRIKPNRTFFPSHTVTVSTVGLTAGQRRKAVILIIIIVINNKTVRRRVRPLLRVIITSSQTSAHTGRAMSVGAWRVTTRFSKLRSPSPAPAARDHGEHARSCNGSVRHGFYFRSLDFHFFYEIKRYDMVPRTPLIVSSSPNNLLFADDVFVAELPDTRIRLKRSRQTSVAGGEGEGGVRGSEPFSKRARPVVSDVEPPRKSRIVLILVFNSTASPRHFFPESVSVGRWRGRVRLPAVRVVSVINTLERTPTIR